MMGAESQLTRLQLTWTAKAGSIIPAQSAVQSTRDSLEEAGYILGSDSYVHVESNRRDVHLFAWFIGVGAWKHALAESEREFDETCQSIFSLDDFMLRSRVPRVRDWTKGSHRPISWCRVPLKQSVRLRVVATPSTKAPPLIAAEHGVIGIWSLPLTRGTRERLRDWNTQAQHVTALVGIGFDDESLCQAWAERMLTSKKAPLVKEAFDLARVVKKETGHPTEVAYPLCDVLCP